MNYRQNRMGLEYAAGGTVHPDVLEDFKTVQAAEARGELRGVGAVRVVRDRFGRRRVVPATDAPRRSPAPSAPPITPPRPSQPVDEPRPAAAYPFPVLVDVPTTSADTRRARLRQAELDLQSSGLREAVDRARRLRRAEESVYSDVVSRLGGAILRPAR
jgi:hypothetical protein